MALRLALLTLLAAYISSCTPAITTGALVAPSHLQLDKTDAVLNFAQDPDVSLPADAVEFSFSAFGDSGWASSHVAIANYEAGFSRAYHQFDPSRKLIGDLNLINWETSIGYRCSAFWSPPSTSRFAFLTHPQELADAASIGFNLIALANNHSFDCLRSPEGSGPLQSASHLSSISHRIPSSRKPVLFSGIYSTQSGSPSSGIYPVTGGKIPVKFISAYVGGDASYCKHIICANNLATLRKQMASATGFRVLALHSWDPKSHSKLKAILSSWLLYDLIDVAVGTGPHLAETVSIIKTPRGNRILATSLGNFLHPSLSAQSNNIVITSRWLYNQSSGIIDLMSVRLVRIACDGSVCVQGSAKTIY